MNKTGILLINLGTPDAPTTSALRKYLRQFLSDPRVIDLPALIRNILLYAFILPTRPRASAKAYQEVWQEDGSPLLIHGRALKEKLSQAVGSDIEVALGMRYGEPSIASAIHVLKANGCDEIVIFPLFPHYASASTGSAIECALTHLAEDWNIPSIRTITDYYTHSDYIACLERHFKHHLEGVEYDHLLLSYHGVPERHIRKSEDASGVSCDMRHACPKVSSTNRFCYRAQCYATSRALTGALSLQDELVSTCFQSRLGKTPWIQPYFEDHLSELYQKGIRKLAVACPAFTADCLETIEEIGIRGRESWLEMGGTSFTLIPCLNAEDHWVSCIQKIIFS